MSLLRLVLAVVWFVSVMDCKSLNEIEADARLSEVSEFCLRELRLAQTFHDFFPDPEDCRFFYHCYLQGTTLHATRNVCPDGQQWTREWKTCWTTDRPCEQNSQTIIDPCRVDSLDALGFYSSRSCAEYYQCDNNLSRLRCCPLGLGWNQTSLHCDYTPCDQTCSLFDSSGFSLNETDTFNVTLNANECAIGNHIYAPIEDNNRKYLLTTLDRLNQDIVECPRTTPYFLLEECACVGPALDNGDETQDGYSPVCMTFNYDNDLGESIAWIDNYGGIRDTDRLCFETESSKLEIPYYSMMDWNVEFSIAFSFRLSTIIARGDKKSLVTNGNDVIQPTIDVSLVEGNVTVTIITHDEVSVCRATQQVFGANDFRFHNVEVVYDGASGGTGLTLAVDNSQTTVPCTSDIEQSPAPLKLGGQFIGCLDNVEICTSL